MLRWISFLLGFLWLAPCSAATVANQVRFPTLAPGGSATMLTATVYQPSGPGPFPAVVVLHHCGGIDADLHTWGRHLADLGYVSILPDSFGPRGTGRVCATGTVRPGERVPDAYAAADYLRTLPEVRGDRIGLIGFSHGAGTITALVSRPPMSAPFRAAVAYYPNCPSAVAVVNVPTLILIGAKDDWTPAAPCAAWGAHVADPRTLDVVVYPNAYHKFDGIGTHEAQGTMGRTHHLEHDQDATVDAKFRAEAFLAQWLKP